ncbi:uncharacterized protein LOC118226713 isoform X2 [Anguilla anguilla]|uniref:uncharacterized protein LOC118226713 isoform X2 n=1 Tax=Anguilla anguilla TaxID=7936 RepID=UPI0015AA1EB3|nr:uncharacterized protein LOC118226713 isoform X2 [Anguilla anguilla]
MPLDSTPLQGKDVFIADMYAIPTWKHKDNNPLSGLPKDAHLKDALVFPAWTNCNGPEHFLLCVLKPAKREILLLDSQFALWPSGFGDAEYSFSNIAQCIIPGCWSEVTGRDMQDIPQQTSGNDCGIFMLMLDMHSIRRWWCVLLMERFSIDGAFFSRCTGWARELPWRSQHISLSGQPPSRHWLTSLSRSAGPRNDYWYVGKQWFCEVWACHCVPFFLKTQEIISDKEPSKWLMSFQGKSPNKVPVYLDNDAQKNRLFK